MYPFMVNRTKQHFIIVISHVKVLKEIHCLPQFKFFKRTLNVINIKIIVFIAMTLTTIKTYIRNVFSEDKLHEITMEKTTVSINPLISSCFPQIKQMEKMNSAISSVILHNNDTTNNQKQPRNKENCYI